MPALRILRPAEMGRSMLRPYKGECEAERRLLDGFGHYRELELGLG